MMLPFRIGYNATKSNEMTCVLSHVNEDPDQAGHLLSLIRIFAASLNFVSK